MDSKVAVFRDAEGLDQALETVKRLKEEAESAYVDDKGSVFNQDMLGAIELELHARACGVHLRRARSTAPRAGERSSAPTSRSATTRSGSSTST